MLKYNYDSASIPKLGNSVDENEDNIVIHPSKASTEPDSILRCAISDGATESSFSREWSNLLVSYYDERKFRKDVLPTTINSLSEEWKSKTTLVDLPWYAEQKAEIGAFATFLGVTVDLKECAFNAVAIGDCALFQVRNNDVVLKFPINSVDGFGNRPDLISTNPKFQVDFDSYTKYVTANVEVNDLILMVTDALAVWFFKQIETKPWVDLSNNLKLGAVGFEAWINGLRNSNDIKNDDVTVAIIYFEK
jgi:hypothetical protein